MPNFAEALKKARAATGMSQQGMADRMLIPNGPSRNGRQKEEHRRRMSRGSC